MRTNDFYYELPEELIAQDPLKDRTSSRLLALNRYTGEYDHKTFKEINKYFKKGDCLVLNNTKVIPARLIGEKINKPILSVSEEPATLSKLAAKDHEKQADKTGVQANGARIELLLLKRRENDVWETLVKPGKRAKPGTRISFGNGLLIGEVLDVLDDGNRLLQFSYKGIFEEILDKLGEMPLPPYITHELEDRNRYQTVYAKYQGSAAAPTAGLHFTQELLEDLERMGVVIAYVTLHVGLGTFRPVKVDNVLDHHMHSEYYQISQEEADKINTAKKSGGRIICVGTTSCRTIESASDENGYLRASSGDTSIFIYPGYKFKLMDGLITNFHLPESTLLMLVSAFAGRDKMLNAYQEAVKERYRFFSFGDAMLII
jgi:S-adenosylmethionine:tRNA ribosyltransferase-isomerase